MSEESNLLIQNKDEQENERKIKWKYVTIIPSNFFIFIGAFIFNYIITEWTQSKIQHEKFPNMTSKSNFAACNVTNQSDPVYISYKAVQHDTSIWMLYYSVAQHIPMFWVNTLLTSYTDTYGRKFLFVLAMFGMCVKHCVITVVIYFNTSLWYVTAMYSFDGILGSSYALFAVSFSYVADITYKDNHRVLGVVIIESVLMVTAVCGSLLSGYFIETLGFGFFNTAVICSALMLLGFAITLLFLPETLHKNKRSPPKSFLGTWKKMIQFYISADFRGKRTLYILLLGSFFVTEIAMLNRSNIETLYFLGQPFCWGPSKIGVFATTRYVALGVVGLGSLPLLQKFLSNEIIAVISAVSSVISLIIEGLAKSNLMIYLVPVTGAFSFVMVPIIRGMMSTMTEPDKQGAMFSSVATIEVLSSISAALLLNEIYAETYSFMNGFVFLVMAGFCVITCILLSAVYYLKKCKNGNYVKPVYETVKVMNNHNLKNDTRNNVTSC